eukprot:6187583-Pleurochrysis_carterae.AAC.2
MPRESTAREAAHICCVEALSSASLAASLTPSADATTRARSNGTPRALPTASLFRRWLARRAGVRLVLREPLSHPRGRLRGAPPPRDTRARNASARLDRALPPPSDNCGLRIMRARPTRCLGVHELPHCVEARSAEARDSTR